MGYNFGEKKSEWSSKQKKELPVFQTPKFVESKKKAIELLESGTYGLTEADFWILMNETKNGKMAYSGLIISHNGCLKINDKLPSDMKFKPECVSIEQNGWGGSLVMVYACPAQGLFTIGEVSPKNCLNAYPYAMAEKRMFDRVVLKLSKIAFAGIYSEAESDEFRDPMDERPTTPVYKCERCGQVLEPYKGNRGKQISVEDHVAKSKSKFDGHIYCLDCIQTLKDAQQ